MHLASCTKTPLIHKTHPYIYTLLYILVYILVYILLYASICTPSSIHSFNPYPQKNHLSGLKRRLLKVVFHNVQDLMSVKAELMPVVRRNKATAGTTAAYGEQHGGNGGRGVKVCVAVCCCVVMVGVWMQWMFMIVWWYYYYCYSS